MYYVYLLRLVNNYIYTGSTPNLKRRLGQHNKGLCISTRDFRPVKLVWYCVFSDKLLARRFEDYLKTGSGQAFRNKRFLR
ncbi:GIY-YIG nuclease family protein [Patescibacteria group bacterium]|nr:GIY-YIG nuclease family protein [Patescibacteria group bacterium]